jgi:hypothetical protein
VSVVCVMCVHKEEIHYEELAGMVMEAKSYDLLSTSWRPRKASGVNPVQFRKPENHRAPMM